jgi:von Willebrand factor type A domain
MTRRSIRLGMLGALLMAFAPACGSSGDQSLFDNKVPGTAANTDPGTGFEPTSPPTTGQDPLTNSCATAEAEAKRTPVYMLFIIDGSGSMDGFNGIDFIPGEREADPQSTGRQTGKKWIAVRGALQAFFDDLAAKPDPSFAVGMYLFSSTKEKSATAVDVPISYVDAAHAASLKARLAPPTFPNSGTPLYAAINGQMSILKSYTPSAPVVPGGKLVLVAMTDGIPTDDKAGCITSVAAAASGTPKVLTFAVGVGNEDASPTTVYDEKFMADLAQAGGTSVTGCNAAWGNADKSGTPCHFQVTPGVKTAAQIRSDFSAAIEKIRDTVASCEFDLVKPAGAGDLDPANVNVVYTPGGGADTTIPQGQADGWTYDDPTAPAKVYLHGKACEALKSDPQSKVRVVIGCKTVTTVTK